MSETSPNQPNTDPKQRDWSDQSVKELIQSCASFQRALLSVLAVADRYDMDPAPLVSSLAMELPSYYRRKTILFAEQLAEGVEPDEALNQIPGLLPPTVVLAFRIALEEGRLGEFYSAILDRVPEVDSPMTSYEEDDFVKISQLCIKVLTLLIILSFILLKIVPEFQKMLQEFGVEFPNTMILLMVICDQLAKYWFVAALVLMALVPISFPAFRRYLRRWSPFTWHQPDLAPLASRRQALAMATESGSTGSSNIQRILNCLPLTRTFKRLAKAQARIEDGNGDWESLAAEKIISKREAEALTRSENPQTQAWLLRWSATCHQNRIATQAAAGTRVFVAVVNVGLGLLVVLAAAGVFMTLIKIMESLN